MTMNQNKLTSPQHAVKEAGKALSTEEMKQIFGGIGGLGTNKHVGPPKRPNPFLSARQWALNP